MSIDIPLDFGPGNIEAIGQWIAHLIFQDGMNKGKISKKLKTLMSEPLASTAASIDEEPGKDGSTSDLSTHGADADFDDEEHDLGESTQMG